MTSAQSFFAEHDLFDHTTDSGLSMLEKNNRLFVAGVGRCNGFTIDCASLSEIDNSGEIIWKKQLNWLDPNQETAVIIDDKIYLGGQDAFNLDSLFIYVSSLDGDSLASYSIPKPEIVEDIYLLSMTDYNGQLVLTGNVAMKDDVAIPGYLTWINLDGTLDTFQFIEKSILWNAMKEFSIDPNGFLTLHYHSLDSDTAFNYNPYYHGILKYNENKEEIWHWQSPGFSFGITEGHDFAIQSDGSMIYKTARDGVNAPSLISVNPDGSFKWLYDFNEDFTFDYTILDIIVAENDDILICGNYGSLLDDIIKIGFVGKLDNDGNELWFKQFITGNYDESIDSDRAGKAIWSSLFGVIETSDGNIVATGYTQRWYEDAILGDRIDFDLWILGLDENGCIEDDCDDWQVVSSNKEIERLEFKFLLFPNPANHTINVNLKTPLKERSQVSILNPLGQIVSLETIEKGNSKKSIDISYLSDGLYFLRIMNAENEFITESFVKY